METTTARPGVSRTNLDGAAAWVLTHPDGARLVVAETGATALSWQVPGPDGAAVDLLDGYTDADELAARDGYRGALLVPWSNRVAGSAYTFGGRRHELEPTPGQHGTALHGLVTGARFARRADTGSDLALRLRTTVRAGDHPGYPFDLDVTVTYALGVGSTGEHRLGLHLQVTNTGDRSAPVALGWHPYLRMPGHDRIDDLEVTVPARMRVLTGENGVPLAGEQAYAGTAAPVRFAPLGATRLDDAFTGLVPDDDGIVQTVVRSPRTGDTLTLEQEPFQTQVVHLFTGDTLLRDPRGGLAVEPCQAVTDAFNRAEFADAVALAPQDQRQLVCDVVYRRG